MATTKQIVEKIIKPMEHAQFKIPVAEEARRGFVEQYFRVLSDYTPQQLDAAMTAVLRTATFTPKPAAFVNAIEQVCSTNKKVSSGLHKITPASLGWPAWVEHKVATKVNTPAAIRHFWAQQEFMLVPTPMPQGDEQ